MIVDTEYPPFATVLRTISGKYYATVMEWDQHQEVYHSTQPQQVCSKDKAKEKAETLGKALGLEVRFDRI